MTLEIQIPEEAAMLLAAEFPDLPRAALEALALEGYRSRRFSESQLRRMLGFTSRIQVHEFLKQRSVPLNYSLDDLEQDREISRTFEDNTRSGSSNAA